MDREGRRGGHLVCLAPDSRHRSVDRRRSAVDRPRGERGILVCQRGNLMASILMAPTAVEATAKAKGIVDGTLASKINALKCADLIRPAIAELTHEVRFAGNDMAHGDINVVPDETDVEEVLALMAEVLREVFQGPASLERIREA